MSVVFGSIANHICLNIVVGFFYFVTRILGLWGRQTI